MSHKRPIAGTITPKLSALLPSGVPFVPLRSPILVARPRDWTASVAWVVLAGLRVALIGIAVLVRVPADWVALAGGHVLLVRGVMVLLSLWIVYWLSTLAFAQLPRASTLLGRTVTFPEQLRRKGVRLENVSAIEVRTQPPPVHEAFVLVMADGSTHILCATHQTGAPRLYAAAARRLARIQRRRAKRARAKARATKTTTEKQGR